MRSAVLILLALAAALPAAAQTPDDEAKVRAVIADWYRRVTPWKADSPHVLMAPGGVDAGPGYAKIPYQRPDKRKASAYIGPRINNELAATALRFKYEIESLKLDPRFAKARVWERGYFYASAAQVTYENNAAALFLLEKMDDGRWLILLHQANTAGASPSQKTSPMPDLRDEYYRRCGSGCDPEADARKARGG